MIYIYSTHINKELFGFYETLLLENNCFPITNIKTEICSKEMIKHSLSKQLLKTKGGII